MNKTIPVFPREYTYEGHTGMSLTDYFAAKALPIAWDAYEKGYCEYDAEDVTRKIAEHVYQIADAMLKARLNYLDQS
jgi:hypothetical protein